VTKTNGDSCGVMAADRRQPILRRKREWLDRLEDLVLGLDDVSEFRERRMEAFRDLENHTACRRFDRPVSGPAAIGLVKSVAVRKPARNPLQDALRVERPRDGVGGAERQACIDP